MMFNIHSLFFPKKINNYYLFSSYEATLYLTDKTLETSLFRFSGNTTLLESTDHYAYTTAEELTQHIQTLYKTLPRNTFIRVVLKNSSVFVKKMITPFTSHEKIQATLPFELEPSLPFPLAEASFDFIVTDSNSENSTLLVAVVKNKIMEQMLHSFIELQIPVDTVSVDVVELYHNATLLLSDKSNTLDVFIAYDTNVASVIVFHDKKFINMRYIVKRTPDDQACVDEIIFTIKTFCKENSITDSKTNITLFGAFPSSWTSQLNATFTTSCTFFNSTAFIRNQKVKFAREEEISYPCLAPLYNTQNTFSLYKEATTLKEYLTFQKNVFTVIFLLLSIFGFLGFHIISQISYLEKQLISNQNKLLTALQKNFPSVQEELTRKNKPNKKNTTVARTITDALALAQKDISQENSIVSALSAENRNSFLEYLAILSTKIDRETIGLHLKKLLLTPSTITLEGQVRNFEALEEFEKSLKETDLFANIPDMQKIDFSIVLPLARKGVS